ncbi:unnamed protein product, partial [Bubo scandiacus]
LSESHLGPPTYQFVSELVGDIGLMCCKRLGWFRKQKGECKGEKRDMSVADDPETFSDAPIQQTGCCLQFSHPSCYRIYSSHGQR